jgi:hypothetical protein
LSILLDQDLFYHKDERSVRLFHQNGSTVYMNLRLDRVTPNISTVYTHFCSRIQALNVNVIPEALTKTNSML